MKARGVVVSVPPLHVPSLAKSLCLDPLLYPPLSLISHFLYIYIYISLSLFLSFFLSFFFPSFSLISYLPFTLYSSISIYDPLSVSRLPIPLNASPSLSRFLLLERALSHSLLPSLSIYLYIYLSLYRPLSQYIPRSPCCSRGRLQGNWT